MAETIDIRMIDLKEIAPAKINYRRSCTEKGMQELTASIRAKGVLQPVLVRPLNGKAAKTGSKEGLEGQEDGQE